MGFSLSGIFSMNAIMKEIKFCGSVPFVIFSHEHVLNLKNAIKGVMDEKVHFGRWELSRLNVHFVIELSIQSQLVDNMKNGNMTKFMIGTNVKFAIFLLIVNINITATSQ